MKKLLIPLILFVLLVVEGIAIDFIPLNFIPSHFIIVPHWIFVFLILVALFYDTDETAFAIIYGVIFGLLTDIVYTDILGVYMFIYPLAIYLMNFLKRIFQTNLLITFIVTMIGLTIVESFILFVYTFIGEINVHYQLFVVERLVPTLIANLIFLLIMYPIFFKRLFRWQQEQLGNF